MQKESNKTYSLVIPLWNEGGNVVALVEAIEKAALSSAGMSEAVLVNNGSTDSTAELISQLAKKYTWIRQVNLKENLNYGGGIYEGCRYAKSEYIAYIPGDLQISPEDVGRLWLVLQEQLAKQPSGYVFVKGYRVERHDPAQTRLVSKVYTWLANTILSLGIKDVNGLPKIFHRGLLDLLPAQRMRTFMFDVQLIYVARQANWLVHEVPVVFWARRSGVSSWSRKRLQVYMNSIMSLFTLRKLRGVKGEPLQRVYS